jgi:hypothetical protein
MTEPGTADGGAARPRRFGRRLVLGIVVLAASWGAALVLRRRRIRTVDLTAPDAFGSAVVRE